MDGILQTQLTTPERQTDAGYAKLRQYSTHLQHIRHQSNINTSSLQCRTAISSRKSCYYKTMN